MNMNGDLHRDFDFLHIMLLFCFDQSLPWCIKLSIERRYNKMTLLTLSLFPVMNCNNVARNCKSSLGESWENVHFGGFELKYSLYPSQISSNSYYYDFLFDNCGNIVGWKIEFENPNLYACVHRLYPCSPITPPLPQVISFCVFFLFYTRWRNFL